MIKTKRRLYLIALCFLWSNMGSNSYCQSSKRISVELLGSAFANSEKQSTYNTNEHIYYEARLGYRLTRYFETSLSVGYQLRNYIYFAQFQQPYSEALLIMDRHYIPVSANIRLYISEFFYENLKLWKKRNKWDVYLQLSLLSIKGRDIPDPNETHARSQGAYVPFYKYPYVDVYDRFQISYVAGVRFNLNKSFAFLSKAERDY